MTKSLVKEWMSPKPITVDSKVGVSVAYHLMRLNEVRRLLVLNDNDELVGIVTWGDIRAARPKSRASLETRDAWESHFLTATMEIREIMTPNPVTVSPDTSMREAARLMLEHKIGGVPVLDGKRVAGILTETDLCRFVVEMARE